MAGYAFSDRSRTLMQGYTDIIDAELNRLKKNAAENEFCRSSIAEAMWYSLSAGGKRIRPVLVLEFCRVCGGDFKDALPAACAMEMVHTFSLIHDDLPCMDNDDMRRGKPSCHKAYGEDIALLAGDALLNLAYGLICGCGLQDGVKLALIKELSEAVGLNGMIGGQVIDTAYKGKMTEDMLLDMYGMKTGALLKASCKIGCIAANADKTRIEAAEAYAEKLGLAFQIIDDILDITGDEKLLGKPVGSDGESGKRTYAAVNGIAKSRETAAGLTEEALSELDKFEDNGFLKELTAYLLKRDY